MYQFLRFLIFCILHTTLGYGASFVWVAESPNDNINSSASWDPPSIPGSGGTAIFDSTILGISITPTENSIPFSVLEFNFPNEASLFTFYFNNQPLFLQTGIWGTVNTNPTIYITNTNNDSSIGNLLGFGIGSTSGSSKIVISNSSLLSGTHSSSSLGVIDSMLSSSGPFTISSNGQIEATNTGVDAANGSNNAIVNINNSQLDFSDSFTVGNNVSLAVSNIGNFSGGAAAEGISVITNHQFLTSGSFFAGNDFNCTIENLGEDSSNGIGNNSVALINASQMLIDNNATFGNDCNISISNNGVNSSNNTTTGNIVGYANDYQFITTGNLLTGDNFNLNVSSTGTDTSTGYGGSFTGVVLYNTPDTGKQVVFQSRSEFGDGATITVSLNGNYSGSNTNAGAIVGTINLQQIVFGNDSAPTNLVAGDDFSLNINNSGIDSGNGVGGDQVGTGVIDQALFYTSSNFGNNTNIHITNIGNYSGHADSGVSVGSIGGNQFKCLNGSFQAGNNFTFRATNSGVNTGSGAGSNYIGTLTSNLTGNTQQAYFSNGLTLGKNALFYISNSGTNSATSGTANNVGSFLSYGKQLFVSGTCTIDDDLQITLLNSGVDDSVGGGGNSVGYIENNTTDNSGSQLYLHNGATIGKNATITISNTGLCQTNTSSNNIGSLDGQQFCAAANSPDVNCDVEIGDNFSITVSNSGTNNASGQDTNLVGFINVYGDSQVYFDGVCSLGNNGSFIISNSGINYDQSGSNNFIGYINGNQIIANGSFIGGKNLNLSIDNSCINAGDPTTNYVGLISNCQLLFNDTSIFDSNSIIKATNSGTVNNSQMVFAKGFNVLSGKVQIKAINTGTVRSYGINIQGANSGGNAEITLSNNSLFIETTLSNFTIGGLNGDSASSVESLPELIINTDDSTDSIFSGSILNYPSTTSTLQKNGFGTQTLAGINTYTGLTTIQEGILIVNGSIAGNVLINENGTLKGNGTINNAVTNAGTISPGESIGTLTLGDYTNNGGTYLVEVNGLGQSDLIDSTGTATLNGGEVVVSSVNDTLKFRDPYTILTSISGVTGSFNDATSSYFINPILTYDASNVYLTIYPALINAADACNQYGVATNLDNIASPSTLQNLLIGNIALSSEKDAQNALESLSGFQYTNDIWFTEITTRRLFRRLYDSIRPLVIACNDCTVSYDNWTTWLETGYNYTNMKGSKAYNSSVNSFQITGGLQKSFWSNFTTGLAGSYEYDHTNYKDGKANRNAGYIGTYALYRPSLFYGLLDLVYGHAVNNIVRNIQAGDLSYKAYGSPTINTFSLYSELGFNIHPHYVRLQPFFGIQYGQNWRQKMEEEQINGWGLTINPYNWSTANSRLGLHLSDCKIFKRSALSLDVAWNYLLTSNDNKTNASFQDFGDVFNVCGNYLDRSSIDYALTLLTCIRENLQGYFEFSGESWEHANTFGVTAGIEFSW
jgi:autotransporter-associated beta strand protein